MEFSAACEAELHEIRDEIALAAWRGVTDLTPVDTGRARYSWNFSYATPDTKVPPEGIYDHPPTPALQGKNAPFTAVFVTSSLDYIIPLEEGWSAKSERMVEKTLFDLTLRMNTFLGGN